VPGLSRVELVEAMATGNFATIIGTEEGSQIDFKQKPYDLAGPKGRRHLVADVAAFANHRGGVIVMGIATQQEAATQREIASSVVGVSAQAVNDDQYLKLIRAHVDPLVRDVDVRHYDGLYEGNRCHLVAVVVEAQAESDRPFIVNRVGEGDEKDVPHAFGWPTRSGSDTHWERGPRVQQLLATGLRPGPVPPPQREGPSAAQLAADEHLALIESLEDFGEWGYIGAQTVPRELAGMVKDFYGEFRDQLCSWRGVRENGFNLRLDRTAVDLLEDGLSVLTSRSALVVSRSGVVTAAAVASPDFLGWAQHERTPWDELEQLRINPFPLVEYITETIRFAYEKIDSELAGVSWRLRAFGRHLIDRVPVALKTTTGHPWPDELRPAMTDSFDVEVEGTGDWSADSFELLAEMYGRGFGVGRASVPFARQGKIDFELMESAAQ
jgi:hypothetical protein